MDIAHNTIESITITPSGGGNGSGGNGSGKTLSVHDHAGLSRVPDAQVWGDPYTWVTIAKAHSATEGWMKTTKASEIKGYGCIIQATTQHCGQVAEALCFIPGVRISPIQAPDGTVTGRRLEASRFYWWRKLARFLLGI